MEACNHPAFEPRLRTQSNGVLIVSRQCLTCGSSLGNLKRDSFDVATLKPWSNVLRAEWDEKRRVEWENNQRLNKAKLSEWWIGYNAYLCSEHWRLLRAFVLRRDPQCQVCFSRRSDQVHHVSYEGYKRFGISFPVECVGICSPCHGRLHPMAQP
jgi:hypothetical protein